LLGFSCSGTEFKGAANTQSKSGSKSGSSNGSPNGSSDGSSQGTTPGDPQDSGGNGDNNSEQSNGAGGNTVETGTGGTGTGGTGTKIGTEDGQNTCRKEGQGKIVVTNDEWLMSDFGFRSSPDAAKFAQNIAKWLGTCATRPTGQFYAYSSNFSLSEPNLAAALKAQGHTWEQGTSFNPTLENLLKYDWIFLAGPVPVFDANVFAEYVRKGGGLYIAAGTAGFSASPVAEANAWNPLLSQFGLQLASSFNRITQVIPISHDHLIFKDVSGLYQNNGNSISTTADATTKTQILIRSGSHGLYAIFDGSL